MMEQERRKDKLMEQETHEKHHEYIATLIQRENQKMVFRQAVIEKTTASLIWSIIVGIGLSVWNYIKIKL